MLLPKTFDPGSIQRPHLVTIPYSHYCELSRWALEFAGIDFEEMQYIPGYHAKIVGRLRQNKADRSESSYVGQESGVHGGRRKYSVPLLCLPGGRIVRDSWEIVEYALGAVEPKWKTTLDQELGIAVRQLGYHYLLAPESKHLINRMIASGSLIERLMWFFLGGKIRSGMSELLAITSENADRAKQTILRVFETVGGALADRGGTLSADEKFGANDIAFCSLSAYCLMPENFGNGAVQMPGMAEFAPEFQDFIRRCRATEAGRYVLQCYEKRGMSAS